MDCGAVRSLLRQRALSDEQEARLTAHLASCPACMDDEADPVGSFLRQTSFAPVQPPITLTTSIMARLPQAAPQVLYAREQQQQRWQRVLGGLGLLTASVILLLVSVWQGVAARSSGAMLASWGGSATSFGHFLLRLALVSKSVLQTGTPLAAILIMLAVLAGVVAHRLPSLGMPRAVIATVLTLGLILALAARYPQVENMSAGQQGIHTVQAPISVVDGTTGDVLSLFGDIQVQGHIRGDVATLAGRVILAPGTRVDGSVLSGAGTIPPTNAQVAGGIVDGPIPAPAQVVQGQSSATEGGLTRLGGLLAAFIALLLAGLWLLLQPERLYGASEWVRTAPLKAVGLGLGAAVVLHTLCLAASVVLAATVFGTVLIPLVLLVAHLPYLRGIAVVGQALGYLISRSDEPVHGLWGIAMQAVVIMVLVLIAPLGSLAAFYLLGSLGLGASLLGARRPQLSF